MRGVPGLAYVGKEARRNLDRREHSASLLGIPRQDFRGSIHVRIREPRLDRVHQLCRDERALVAGISAGVVLVSEVKKGGQCLARLDQPLRDELWDGLDFDGRKIGIRSLARVDEGHRGIGSTEVDADFHAAIRSRTLNSSFQRRPSRVTHHNSSWTTSVTTVSRVTGTSSSLSSSAGSDTSIGESSWRSSPTSSRNVPAGSFFRAAEQKKRNSAGCPTTRPKSRPGIRVSVPSSMPNGATVTALSGARIPGTDGMALSIPT